MKKYQLTFFFVITSMVVIAVAALVVNSVIGDLAEDNLLRIAEENTTRDAAHIQSMMRGQHSVLSLPSAGPPNGNAVQQPTPLTLEHLASPQGLTRTYAMLVEGLNVVKFNLFDLGGRTVWSTDPETLGVSKRESPLFQKAVAGGVSSKQVSNDEHTDISGVRRLDVVETFVPLRESPSGPIIGAMEICRDISGDVAIQVGDAKSTVLRTTVATMGGLFLVLVGFIVTADVTLYRAGRREVSLVEDQLADREQAETALALQAAELAHSNQELQQFAYVASHDLQEPLRMVTSYVQLLERRYKDQLDADANEFIDYAVDGASRMQGLINDLLAYSRVGTQAKEFEPTDCKAVLERVLADLHTTVAEGNAVVSHDALPTITADPSQLGQVFQNLISNAIKYRCDRAPEIHISAERKDSEWLFSVRDNGIGIDPQYAERIFVIFQRLHTREEYPGTGIGLAVCKKIVERHRGRIWVESEAGKGSTFYFTIATATGDHL